MARLGDSVLKVRSKNAGPFWVTIDVFCGDLETFEKISKGLSTGNVARLFGQPTQEVKRFDIADLNVVKFSFPRPIVQGTATTAICMVHNGRHFSRNTNSEC